MKTKNVEKTATIAEKKTYRFEVSGYCELDIEATTFEEAEEIRQENMEKLFNKGLFTDYEFIGEIVMKRYK